jgi:phage gp36-like protein
MAYVDHTNFSALPPSAYADIDDSDDAIDAEGELASALADSYLRKRKTLPLVAPYDPALVAAVEDIVAWRLLKFRGFNPVQGADEDVKRAKDQALEWLTLVSIGDVEVGGQDSSSDQVDLMGTLADEGESVDWHFVTGEDCE